MSTLADVTIYDLIANRPSPSIPGRLFFASDTNYGYYDTGSAWDTIVTPGGGGGGSFPLTVIQEAAYIQTTNASSFTITFPQAAQSSGATMFCLVSGDGSVSIGLPSGWTGDIDQTEATYARFVLCHKTSASDTSATFTATTSNFSIYFFEVSGSHALDQHSAGGTANAAIVALPAITPAAGALVFGAVAYVVTEFGFGLTGSLDPAYKTINVPNGINGGRALSFYVGTVAAANVSTTPPAASLGAVLFFASGGIAYATFSLL